MLIGIISDTRKRSSWDAPDGPLRKLIRFGTVGMCSWCTQLCLQTMIPRSLQS